MPQPSTPKVRKAKWSKYRAPFCRVGAAVRQRRPGGGPTRQAQGVPFSATLRATLVPGALALSNRDSQFSFSHLLALQELHGASRGRGFVPVLGQKGIQTPRENRGDPRRRDLPRVLPLGRHSKHAPRRGLPSLASERPRSATPRPTRAHQPTAPTRAPKSGLAAPKGDAFCKCSPAIVARQNFRAQSPRKSARGGGISIFECDL